MRAYKICIDDKYYVEYDTIKLVCIIDDANINHTIMIVPINISKKQYDKESHYTNIWAEKGTIGIDYERKKTAMLINTAWESCIGELPHPGHNLYIPIVKFKKMLVDELEKYFLEWESGIRSEYEKSNHWLYINDSKVKLKIEEKLGRFSINNM